MLLGFSMENKAMNEIKTKGQTIFTITKSFIVVAIMAFFSGFGSGIYSYVVAVNADHDILAKTTERVGKLEEEDEITKQKYEVMGQDINSIKIDVGTIKDNVGDLKDFFKIGLGKGN